MLPPLCINRAWSLAASCTRRRSPTLHGLAFQAGEKIENHSFVAVGKLDGLGGGNREPYRLCWRQHIFCSYRGHVKATN